MRKRQSRRFTKRLEVTFSANGSKHRGISSDLSSGGLFIRTQNGLTPGSLLDLEVYLPDNKVGQLKGIVRRTTKTALSVIKNGMGVELIDRDQNFLDFLGKFDMLENQSPEDPTPSAKAQDEKPGQKTDMTPESAIIVCPNCNVKNRVRTPSYSLGAKCGKCGAALEMKDIS